MGRPTDLNALPAIVETAPRWASVTIAPEERAEVTARFLGATLADQYQILEKIGEGAMGVVFRARQINVNRDVAVKVLHGRLATNQSSVARFENEAKIISQLRHPNTLRLFDCLRTPAGELLIVTELLNGDSLSTMITSKGHLSVSLAVRIVDAILGSLSEAHAAGIVHRDLKPENVFIDRVRNEEVVKVLDFGIARIMENGESLTVPGTLNGTPLYMAPEQIKGERGDHRSDIYALGGIFYEMLAGSPPFTGDSLVTILGQHLQERPFSLRSWIPTHEISEELDQFILQMLEKRPEDRPQSVDDIRARLARIAGPANAMGALQSPVRSRPTRSRPTPVEGAVHVPAASPPPLPAFAAASIVDSKTPSGDLTEFSAEPGRLGPRDSSPAIATGDLTEFNSDKTVLDRGLRPVPTTSDGLADSATVIRPPRVPGILARTAGVRMQIADDTKRTDVLPVLRAPEVLARTGGARMHIADDRARTDVTRVPWSRRALRLSIGGLILLLLAVFLVLRSLKEEAPPAGDVYPVVRGRSTGVAPRTPGAADPPRRNLATTTDPHGESPPKKLIPGEGFGP